MSGGGGHEGAPPEVWPLVVIGGGPAGIAAATEAARAGMRCLLVDEAPTLGGQIYRQLPREFKVKAARSLGRDYRRGVRLRAAFAQVSDRVEVRSATCVLDIEDGPTVVCASPEGGTQRVVAERVVLATGAYDRPVPFPGWTLPGVLTAGGAQTLMKSMRVKPGDRAIVAGTGPLLMVVANQLHHAGVKVVAVLEAGRSAFRPGMVAKAWRHRGLLTDGARYRLGLLEAGIPIKYNHTVFQAHGTSALRSVTYGPVSATDWQPDLALQQRADVDLLVVGFGFVPSTELCELAGCRTQYLPQLGGWVPVRDAMMRTTVDGIFAAGDGSGVAGVLVAVEEGRVAGVTAAEEAGAISSEEANRRRREPLRRLRSLAGLRAALDEISTVRPGLSQLATDRTVVCRCEEVTRAEVTAAVQEGARDLQSVKLLCRLGMGACQGRNCAPSVAALLSTETGRPPAEAGRINPRPPVRPVTMATLACNRRDSA